MDVKRCAATAAALLTAAFVSTAPALADDPKVAPPGGEVLQMQEHMTGSVGQTGDFPGRLVCLRSKESFTPLSASECASGDRVYALEMKGEKSMRPIQAASPEVEAQLHDMIGRNVRIQGRFHNETNTVIAGSVRADEQS
jgi:hypothetical protein